MRITKSSETSTGNLSDLQVKAMKEINLNPAFDRKSKPWKLVRIPKTTTRNVAWNFQIGDSKFIALQHYSRGEAVTIFATDEKFKTTDAKNIVKNYSTYVDLEVAVDLFYEEYSKKHMQNAEETTENQEQ